MAIVVLINGLVGRTPLNGSTQNNIYVLLRFRRKTKIFNLLKKKKTSFAKTYFELYSRVRRNVYRVRAVVYQVSHK